MCVCVFVCVCVCVCVYIYMCVCVCVCVRVHVVHDYYLAGELLVPQYPDCLTMNVIDIV